MVGVMSSSRGVDLSELSEILGSKTAKAKALEEISNAKKEAIAEQAKVSTGQLQLKKDRAALDRDKSSLEQEKSDWREFKALEEGRLVKWNSTLAKQEERFKVSKAKQSAQNREDKADAKKLRSEADRIMAEATALDKKARAALENAEKILAEGRSVKADYESRMKQVQAFIGNK